MGRSADAAAPGKLRRPCLLMRRGAPSQLRVGEEFLKLCAKSSHDGLRGRVKARNVAWFNRAPAWVTVLGLIGATTLARSASEGWGYPRLRF